MIEFIDKTSNNRGTPVSRKTLMGVQGFVAKTIVFNADGSIVETNENGEVLTTTFNEDGSIAERFAGKMTITKTTKFNQDGSITEEIL